MFYFVNENCLITNDMHLLEILNQNYSKLYIVALSKDSQKGILSLLYQLVELMLFWVFVKRILRVLQSKPIYVNKSISTRYFSFMLFYLISFYLYFLFEFLDEVLINRKYLDESKYYSLRELVLMKNFFQS